MTLVDPGRTLGPMAVFPGFISQEEHFVKRIPPGQGLHKRPPYTIPYGDGTIVQVRAFHSEGKIFQNTVPKELCVASIFKPSGKNVNVKPKRIKFITEELQDVLEMDVKKKFLQHQ